MKNNGNINSNISELSKLFFVVLTVAVSFGVVQAHIAQQKRNWTCVDWDTGRGTYDIINKTEEEARKLCNHPYTTSLEQK